MTVLDQIEDLQRQLRSIDDFAAVRARYELRDTGRGALVLALRSPDPLGEPDHCICPSCAERRERQVLQPNPKNLNVLLCPSCKAEFLAHPAERSPAMTVPVRRSVRGLDEGGLTRGWDVTKPYDDD